MKGIELLLEEVKNIAGKIEKTKKRIPKTKPYLGLLEESRVFTEAKALSWRSSSCMLFFDLESSMFI
jgi:hypothetical protein